MTAPAQPAHAHRWTIASPTPGCLTVSGQCGCGARREFQAWATEDLEMPKASWMERAKRRKGRELHGLDDFA